MIKDENANSAFIQNTEFAITQSADDLPVYGARSSETAEIRLSSYTCFSDLTPACISNYTHYKMWDEITYLSIPEVSNFIPRFTAYMITYPCWNWSDQRGTDDDVLNDVWHLAVSRSTSSI